MAAARADTHAALREAARMSVVNASTPAAAQSFLLQRVQPAMTGLIDGSLSTLAPIFAVALATHRPHYAFFAGLATAIGAGISMAFSEGLSALVAAVVTIAFELVALAWTRWRFFHTGFLRSFASVALGGAIS